MPLVSAKEWVMAGAVRVCMRLKKRWLMWKAVFCGSAEPQGARFAVADLDLHSQERGGEGLALRVGHQRERATASETLMQQKIERPEIRQFKSLDRALT